MRKLILSMQISLDGFAEGPGGDMSWLFKDDNEQWQDLFEMLQSVDLFLLGGGMFPDYRAFWKQALTNPQSTANQLAYAKLADKTKHIVFSHIMKDPGWANTQIVGGSVADEVAKIKAMPGKDIQVVGGAKLAAAVMDAGLVDEFRLRINPTILGGGKSIFRDQHWRYGLELVGVRSLKSGVVIARYRRK